VHHGAEADGGQIGQLGVVFLLNVLLKLSIGVLKTCPDVVDGIGPDAVFQTVFPVVVTGCNGRVILIHQHGLDAGGAQFYAKDGLACDNGFADGCGIHIMVPPEIVVSQINIMFLL